MAQKFSVFFWIFLLIGGMGIFLPDLAGDWTFARFFITVAQLYLFGFSAFLVLKQVFFYRIKGNVNVIRLVKKSDHQNTFMMQGVIIALLALVYVYQTETLVSSGAIMVGVLLFYYLMQVILSGNPAIYLDEASFSYDDYFVQVWPWRYISKIDVDGGELRISGANKDFELDFDLIDDFDFVRLNDEVERNVLDGHFSSEKSSKQLLEVLEDYAHKFKIQFVK